MDFPVDAIRQGDRELDIEQGVDLICLPLVEDLRDLVDDDGVHHCSCSLE